MNDEKRGPEHGLWSFGPFRLDVANAQLWRGQEVIRLTNKALAVLCYLVEHSGQLVTKDDLFATVWPEVVVSDSALVACIGELRRALGDARRMPQFIETVHGRGYRFLAPISPTPPPVQGSTFNVPGQETAHPVRSETPTALPLPEPLLDKPSIIVLPFVNLSGDPQQDYFSDGLTEVLTGDLSQISSLFVIGRNSAFTYKGKAVKVQDVGREMGVRYVLEGGVLKAKDTVRITAQLIDATSGYHLWAERYDQPLQNLFALQDEIVQKIVTTLKLQLTLQEQGWVVRKHTDNLAAYDYFLRGLDFWYRFTKEANAQARQMLEKAVALDSRYAEAYAWLSMTYSLEWTWRWSVAPQTLQRALALAQEAVALDDALPVAHSVLGFVYTQQQQFDRAFTEGERAITLDPNHADSYAFQAEVLSCSGQPEEALRLVEQAMRLNPRYPFFYGLQLGFAYNLTGRYAEAVAAMKDVLSRSPDHFGAHFNLAFSYLWQWAFQQSLDPQTLEQALAMAQRAIALSDSGGGQALLGIVYLWQKRYEPALPEMERAIVFNPYLANRYAILAEMLSRVSRPEEALRM